LKRDSKIVRNIFLGIGCSIIYFVSTFITGNIFGNYIFDLDIIFGNPGTSISIYGWFIFIIMLIPGIWEEVSFRGVISTLNLSAVAIVLAIGKYLKNHKEIIPKNTEIRLISFGCEEAGLRGAFRYVEEHYNELKKYDAQCVNMDGIHSKDNISIIDFEPTTRTKHSDVVVQKVINAAKNSEIKLQSSGLGGSSKLEKLFGQITGGTDAAAFSKAKIKAVNITAMDLKQMLGFYHQPTDTVDKIEKGSLE
ncbi:unnamed protein product, partial [marine sediment metagenome]